MFSIWHNQRGALFGMDARLGLLIFGVLAIIAGYSAFGRLDMARDARLMKELKAMDEALLGMQSDLGVFLLFGLTYSEPPNDIKMLWDKELLRPRLKTFWNGPYLTNPTQNHPVYGKWGLIFGDEARNPCLVGSKCFAWIQLTDVPAEEWLYVNKSVDESGGSYPEEYGRELETGRVQADQNLDPRILYFRSVERPKQ